MGSEPHGSLTGIPPWSHHSGAVPGPGLVARFGREFWVPGAKIEAGNGCVEGG